MSGPPPSHGVRFELALTVRGEGHATFEGGALHQGVRVPLVVHTEASGATATTDESQAEVAALGAETLRAIERLACALVRAATRVELASGQPIPRKIVRWRELSQ